MYKAPVFPPSIEEVTKFELVNAPAPSSASGHPSPSESKSLLFGMPSPSKSEVGVAFLYG